MKSVIVVEPDNLVRSGILQILQGSSLDLTCKGMDYSQLFAASTDDTRYDLMLLATPDVFDRAVQLVNAAVRAYAPQRILLLSEESELHYSLHSLPVAPAGYLSKPTSPTMLTAAVSLVLAGGQCFPSPPNTDNRRATDTASMGHTSTNHPRRRWYDKAAPPTQNGATPTTDRGIAYTGQHHQSQAATPETSAAQTINPTKQDPVSQAAENCKLLGITRRQHEILLLLAKGESIKSISRLLEISASTVKTHTDAMYQRLGVHSRTAAVYKATQQGANLRLSTPNTTDQRGSRPSANMRD